MIELFWRRRSARAAPPVPTPCLRRTPFAKQVDAATSVDSDLMDFDDFVTLPGSYWHSGDEQGGEPDVASLSKTKDS